MESTAQRGQTPGLMLTPAVILARPLEEGNVGSVARAMANMGLDRLILVEPAPPLGGIAKGFGVGGWHILENVERHADLSTALAPFQRVIGTTSTRARKLLGCRVLNPRALPKILAEDPPETSTALVFGPEDKGLSRQDLALCGTLVNVPTDSQHPTLNLAQAVLIVAYELLMARRGGEGGKAQSNPAQATPASSADLDRLIEHVSRLLERAGYPAGSETRGNLRELRRLAARSGPSLKETRLIRKVCLRLISILPETGSHSH